MCDKRPINVSNETYEWCLKRPINRCGMHKCHRRRVNRLLLRRMEACEQTYNYYGDV
jgi:hypothetical protein